MSKTFVIFDDTVRKSEVIEDVIGKIGFCDVVVKKRRLVEYYCEDIQNVLGEIDWKIVKAEYEFNKIIKGLESSSVDNLKVLHCFSNYIISDIKKASLTFQKIRYIDDDYVITLGKNIVGIMFTSAKGYLKYLREVCKEGDSVSIAKMLSQEIEIDGVVDIGEVGNFIQCITGNFDSRYFNSLKGNEYKLVKSSTNKKKIKSEYTYYHLLPEDMKYWYVMPFNYEESQDSSSYTMERLHMTDLAIKWVHGSINEEEFTELMNKYFYFFRSRHTKSVSKEEYKAISDELYIRKVSQRIEDFQKLKGYDKIDNILEIGFGKSTINRLYDKYIDLKEKIENNKNYDKISVIGHGDPCFANALYNKSTKMLKFIDPKGALTETELWTNPYYDIAKLSHSVCGLYDFFNNGLYDISISNNFRYNLDINFNNEKYKKIFKEKLEENGYDYWTVRIYEVSLFVSMLPLHMDNPHKVFGFILNAFKILKEIEEHV